MTRRNLPPLSPSTHRPHAHLPAALTPYRGPWDRRRAAHLVRWSSFGPIQRVVDRAFNDGSATAAVSRPVTALSDPLPEALVWYTQRAVNQDKASSPVGHVTYPYYKPLRRHGLGKFRITYSLSQGGPVRRHVFDIRGRLVRVLADHPHVPGIYTQVFADTGCPAAPISTGWKLSPVPRRDAWFW